MTTIREVPKLEEIASSSFFGNFLALRSPQPHSGYVHQCNERKDSLNTNIDNTHTKHSS